MQVVHLGEKGIPVFIVSNLKPFIYLASNDAPYMFAHTFGRVEQIEDMRATLDWWISAPWYLNIGDGTGVEMYGNA